MMTELKPESATIKAIKSLAEKLDLPYDKSLQDWSYKVADPDQLKKYYRLYDRLIDEDEKIVLMEVMIQATDDQIESTGLSDAWASLEQRLIWDFHIHEHTIHHWINGDFNSLDNCREITPDMRALESNNKIPKKRILFVCTVNLMRSATAYKIYSYDMRFEVKSAGTHYSAETVLSKELLDWSDTVVVMEDRHMNFIRRTYPEIYKIKNIVCLYVPDNYDYMQAELITLLRVNFEDVYRSGLI